MDKIYFSTKSVDLNDSLSVPCFIVDTKVQWDAEINSKEPGYDIFLAIMSKLLFTLSKEEPVCASFTERKIQNLSTIKKTGLEYKKYPLSFIENAINKIFTVLNVKEIGSGVTCFAKNVQDVKKIVHLSKRSNEWLFFYIGHEAPVWLEYKPYYIMLEDKGLDDYNYLSGSLFILYHEINLNYFEIHSFVLPHEIIYKCLERLCIEYKIQLIE